VCALGFLDLALASGTCATINLLDRTGLLPCTDQHHQRAIGFEISGVVQRLGPEAKQLSKGDAVVAYLPLDANGGCCSYVVVREHNLGM
jgi:NADPH:quinone reductase-like Zn-dependent oxidoreductase